MKIRLDDLSGQEILALLEEHVEEMRSISPPESKHALDLASLRKPSISFWTIWDGSTLAGCAALQELDASHAEIKSMRTARSYRGRGVARMMMQHLLQLARERGYQRLSLETGSQEFFEPARRLYAACGFSPCGPFAGYRADPSSVFMTRLL